MQRLIDDLLDLVFPPRCAACGTRGVLLCGACRAGCRRVPAAANHEQHRRLDCPVLASTAGAYIFEGALREAVHALKYQRRARMALPLGDLLAAYVREHVPAVDAIAPVPLHPQRLRMRGFNQAALLARRLGDQIGVPLLEAELARVRQTAQQADLSRSERRHNVAEAFSWVGAAPPPERVLVVDDVLTTGATVAAVAEALHRAGARELHALALARGL